MLTIGTDSYTSIEIANEYITKYYLSTDERLLAWNDLSDNDKEVYLRRACDSLNRLPYRGYTYTALQPLPFPRYPYNNGIMAYRELIAPYAYLYPELYDIPGEVVAAQIEEALELAAPSSDTEKFELMNSGLKSYSIGHLSESFDSAGEGSIQSVLVSQKAQELIRGFVGGSYEIC